MEVAKLSCYYKATSSVHTRMQCPIMCNVCQQIMPIWVTKKQKQKKKTTSQHRKVVLT